METVSMATYMYNTWTCIHIWYMAALDQGNTAKYCGYRQYMVTVSIATDSEDKKTIESSLKTIIMLWCYYKTMTKNHLIGFCSNTCTWRTHVSTVTHTCTYPWQRGLLYMYLCLWDWRLQESCLTEWRNKLMCSLRGLGIRLTCRAVKGCSKTRKLMRRRREYYVKPVCIVHVSVSYRVMMFEVVR